MERIKYADAVGSLSLTLRLELWQAPSWTTFPSEKQHMLVAVEALP